MKINRGLQLTPAQELTVPKVMNESVTWAGDERRQQLRSI